MKQVEAFNHLMQAIWIFDFVEERNRWTNTAGLALWNSPSVEEFCSRDRKQNRSESTFRKLQQTQAKIETGGSLSVDWTLYPKGVATTVHITITGIRLEGEDHYCMLFHAVPVDTETLETKSLRGVEMLRHLPMAVCQFDMSGKLMFQNLWAQLPEEQPQHADKPEDNHAMVNATATATTTTTAAKVDNSNQTAETKQTEEESTATSDFLRRFINPKVAQQAFAAMQTTNNHVIQLEAEVRSTTKLGKSEWSDVCLRRTTDPVTGNPVILYSAQDKSDMKNAQMERAASLQKSEFLAIMAHEIRTPLHQVIGFIDLLDQTQPLSAEQKGYVQLLQSSAQGLMTVISDVLDYSKLEAGKLKIESIPYEPLSVVEGTMAAVRATCEDKNLYLTLDWCKEIPFRLLGDPNRVRQILLNLLSNAIKFTRKGGIRVTSHLLPTESDTISELQKAAAPYQNTTRRRSITHGGSKSNNDRGTVPRRSIDPQTSSFLQVRVSDTGTGICEENQQLIFQKYQQEHLSTARTHGGTGLGLTICQLLVDSMGGSIGVQSQLGQGSEFWFLLPVQEVPKQGTLLYNQEDGKHTLKSSLKGDRSNNSSIHQPRHADGFNVLVAEDNRLNQKLITNMLRRLGHRTTIAGNGQIAIDTIAKQQQQQQPDSSSDSSKIPFDIVLMDIQMPVMDGLEATRRLRTMGYTNLPILALTASVKQHDYKELGFDDWLAKPTPLKDLKEKILRTTGNRGGGGDSRIPADNDHSPITQ